jgi:hypothetical protein
MAKDEVQLHECGVVAGAGFNVSVKLSTTIRSTVYSRWTFFLDLPELDWMSGQSLCFGQGNLFSKDHDSRQLESGWCP